MRPTMARLVARVRSALGDTGTSPVFADDEIEVALDRWRSDVIVPLRPFLAIGQTATDRWSAPYGDWEEDARVVDASGATVALASADWASGRVVLTTPASGPLYLAGATYDLAGAVADLLEEWATRLARQFDVSLDGVSVQRSQQAEALRLMASQWRARQRVAVGPLVRAEDWPWS